MLLFRLHLCPKFTLLFTAGTSGTTHKKMNNTQTTQKRLTIYDIKRLTSETAPYFFTAKTLKFFGQTMRSFSVKRQPDGRYYISAPMLDRFTGRVMGLTERFFNPANNTLERE